MYTCTRLFYNGESYLIVAVMPQSASISDYSQAISSLTTQLTTDEDPEIGISDAQAKAPAARTE